MWSRMWVIVNNIIYNEYANCRSIYSWILTFIHYHAIRQVTSFPITDTISGSTISYNISSSGIPVQTLPACSSMCNYTVNASNVCSTSSSDIDITVTGANRLGWGQSSQPITVGMWFIVVVYNCCQCCASYLISSPGSPPLFNNIMWYILLANEVT